MVSHIPSQKRRKKNAGGDARRISERNERSEKTGRNSQWKSTRGNDNGYQRRRSKKQNGLKKQRKRLEQYRERFNRKNGGGRWFKKRKKPPSKRKTNDNWITKGS